MQINFTGGIYIRPDAQNRRNWYNSNFKDKNTARRDELRELNSELAKKDVNFIIDKFDYNTNSGVSTYKGYVISDGKVYTAYYRKGDAGITKKEECTKLTH